MKRASQNSRSHGTWTVSIRFKIGHLSCTVASPLSHGNASWLHASGEKVIGASRRFSALCEIAHCQHWFKVSVSFPRIRDAVDWVCSPNSAVRLHLVIEPVMFHDDCGLEKCRCCGGHGHGHGHPRRCYGRPSPSPSFHARATAEPSASHNLEKSRASPVRRFDVVGRMLFSKYPRVCLHLLGLHS